MDINHFDPNFPKAVLRVLQDFARVEAVGGAEQVRSFGKLRMTGEAISMTRGAISMTRGLDAQVIGKSRRSRRDYRIPW